MKFFLYELNKALIGNMPEQRMGQTSVQLMMMTGLSGDSLRLAASSHLTPIHPLLACFIAWAWARDVPVVTGFPLPDGAPSRGGSRVGL